MEFDRFQRILNFDGTFRAADPYTASLDAAWIEKAIPVGEGWREHQRGYQSHPVYGEWIEFRSNDGLFVIVHREKATGKWVFGAVIRL